jgi:hypothetical protein
MRGRGNIANKDSQDEQAFAIIRAHSTLSGVSLSELMRRSGIERSQDWVNKKKKQLGFAPGKRGRRGIGDAMDIVDKQDNQDVPDNLDNQDNEPGVVVVDVLFEHNDIEATELLTEPCRHGYHIHRAIEWPTGIRVLFTKKETVTSKRTKSVPIAESPVTRANVTLRAKPYNRRRW